jgi:threonine/homoserine/homoserine lactone efflux protein
MWSAFGQTLPMAVGAALSPIPIVAVVLMLTTKKARVDGPAFVLGWLIGFGVIGVVVLAIGGAASASDGGSPSTGSNWLKLLLGVVLIRFAMKQWRARPHSEDEDPPMPKWLGAIESFGGGKAIAAGVVLSVVNPKNLLLAVAAAATIAASGISGSDQALAYLLFTIVASLGVVAPVVIYFAMGDRAPEILGRIRTWMVRNNNAILAVIFLVIGAKMLGDAISGFSA